jgi:hypothetical protein
MKNKNAFLSTIFWGRLVVHDIKLKNHFERS